MSDYPNIKMLLVGGCGPTSDWVKVIPEIREALSKISSAERENEELRKELAEQKKWAERNSDEWKQRVADLRRQLAESQKECLEQARLNGMGSEREAKLLARLEEREKELEAWETRFKRMEGAVFPTLQKQQTDYEKYIGELRADVSRLREAVRVKDEALKELGMDIAGHRADEEKLVVWGKRILIARKALSHTPERSETPESSGGEKKPGAK